MRGSSQCVTAWRWMGLLLIAVGANVVEANQFIVAGPAGSSRFGTVDAALPKGVFVVTDPRAAPPGGAFRADVVHHYRPNGTLVATLRGSTSGDLVGEGGIVVLANGNDLACSPRWNNGSIIDASAVTVVRGDTGPEGAVSTANSLVGSSTDDRIGLRGPVMSAARATAAGPQACIGTKPGCARTRSNQARIAG